MKTKKNRLQRVFILLLHIVFTTQLFAQTPPLVYDVENTGAACPRPALPTLNNLTAYAMLPDPFKWANGSGRIASFADWECRRNEIKAQIENYEIGVKPTRPANITATWSAANNTLTVRVTENGQTLTLTSRIILPAGTGPFPAVIGMNSATGSLPATVFSSRNIAQITYNHDQVTTYNGKSANDPFFKLYPTLTANGQYSAWAWGVSRIIDGLELVQAQLPIDTKHLAVTGCSYAGKMALFAGALDERIALTIPVESGGGGSAAWRVSETLGAVEKLGSTNFSWFMQSMNQFAGNNVPKLPHDHHELLAMVAPRALLVLGNSPDWVWLAEEASYVSARAAEDVYKTLGISDRFGFSQVGGHGHCEYSATWNTNLGAFVDKFLLGRTTANTTGVFTGLFPNTDYNKWITAWKGHVIAPPNTNAPVVTITAPLNNASYTEGDNITINATATVPTGTITKVDFYNGTILLGTDATAPYTYTWTNVAGGKYQITAKATSSANDVGTSSVTNVLVTKAVFQTSAAPTIDGTVDALWANYTAVPVTNVLSGTVSSAADLSGNWRAIWDASNLYVLVQVTDDVKRNDAGTDVYNDDGVEVYFDFGNNKPTDYGTNDHQYTFRWNDATVAYEINGHPVTGILKGMTNTATGYIVEVSIPWTTIGGVPAANSLQGFDIMINDDDNGTARDKKMAWSATADDTWDNPSLMGTILLKALNCTPPTATIAVAGTTTVCSGSTVTLNANTGTGFTYLWKKDNVDIAGATAASYIANASGSYTVTVTSGGCSAVSAAAVVTVNALPTAAITAGSAATFCQGGSVILTSSAGSSYIWKNGTTQVGTAATYAATTAGSYTVEVTNANGCKATSAASIVTVNTAPSAPTVTTPVTYCQNATAAQLTATGTALKWYADNTITTSLATAPTPSTVATGTVNYYVSQTASGCESIRASLAVTVNALPTATITSGTATTFCQGGSVMLTSSTGSSYIWKNGTTQVGTTATYSVTTSGSYTVEVTNANGCKATSAATTVTVNALPTAAITSGTATTFCQGGSVMLTSSAGSSYIWKNGTTQVGTSATYSVTTSGSYTVEVTNANGCKATSAATTVTVNAVPSAPTVTSPVSYCQNATAAQLTATGTALKWYADNAITTSLATAPMPSTAAAGTVTYYVSQTTNGCESARAPLAVTVNALPAATVTAGAATTFCSGGSVTLTSGSGSSYIWKNGSAQVGTSATYVATVSGSYTVEVTNASGCKATSAATVVTVNTIPSAPAVASSVTYCQNAQAVALTATRASLKWYDAETSIQPLANVPVPSTVTVGTTTYYVSQTTTGCESTRAEISVVVNEAPVATIIPAGSTTIPSGGSVVLNANAGANLTYIWFKGINQVGTRSSYTATSVGSYVVEVINGFGCKSTSLATDVNAASNQPSIITITSPASNSTNTSPVTISVDATDADGSIVLVEFLDGNTVIGISTEFPYSMSWTDPGDGIHVITVRVTDSNGGITTSAPVTITTNQTTTGLQSGNNVYSKVYPVPAKDEVVIETEIDLVGAAFSVVNVLGQEVKLQVHVSGNNAKVDVSNLSAGTYILFITKDDSVITTKISVIK